MTTRYVCIHGHFYQPPRENPWLDEVELQDSAYPYHDWNERITAECYAPNTAARVLDQDSHIGDIINNYSRMSFNIGPTLLSWMERHKPQVYAGILEADRLSRDRFSGHGSALAQVYNHMIMPLATRRDKITQTLWGIRDFELRFGRFPEGMWLSETAVDTETLEVLADLGIRFTVLAPRQARRIRALAKGSRWHSVEGSRIDPTRAYQCQLPSGKNITLFFYDGPISQELAFSGLLNSGVSYADRLLSAFDEGRTHAQLVHVATDGESYGHHHRHGEMALAYCLHHIESTNAAQITNYGQFLELHPPDHAVEIFDNSSWSCVHGIERWRENCGCNSGRQGWTQAWRRPLRDSLDAVRDTIVPRYEQDAGALVHDPWGARDRYIDIVLDRDPAAVNDWIGRHARRELSKDEKVRMLKLLEMQRFCMLMYTSCGWFFDEISGIETTQVLQYASKAIQLAEELFGQPIEPEFLKHLAGAPSNVLRDGADVYEQYVRPARVDLLRVAAHYGISSVFVDDPTTIALYNHTVVSEKFQRHDAGKFTLATGKLRIRSISTWEEKPISFSVLHLGDHTLHGGVRPFMGEDAYAAMEQQIVSAFDKGDFTEVLKLQTTHFGDHNYSLWHLFKDEQRQFLAQILGSSLEKIEASFRTTYLDNYPVMSFLQSLRYPMPAPFQLAAEYVLNADLKKILSQDSIDPAKLEQLTAQVRKWSITLDKGMLSFVATEWVNARMAELKIDPRSTDTLLSVERTLKILSPLALEPDLWNAQNIYFQVAQGVTASVQAEADGGDHDATAWISAFTQLGDHLHVHVIL
jgi:alpha-amylase/alpha-mannosidase (GH57 family)